MARVTNSDTLPYVDSRYELGILASQRVRDLNGGEQPVVEKKEDKLTVVALREIASGKLDVESVRHEFIASLKTPKSSEDDPASLEVKSEDPTIRKLDAELGSSIMDEPFVDSVVEESDDTPDESEDEE